ncbi:HNH endonuclease [Iamia sp. SCSIO 61187]|uniref:HNH endonuclease signature motif containing protein n=1 Tax=Iamia sp. SCSIO 61187 TaxID=2722752 RepID=UPI001C62E1BE|nr:HNH endonuclease signature motif containing protein [Iamia sp. SCSIO 61187]QYG93777.1 HNH endonuclease [Iamia sp. SCSIO 61187]
MTMSQALQSMPVVEAAFRSGRLGRAKVVHLVDVCTPELAEVFAEHEAYLVSEVARLRVDGAGRFLRAWQQQARLHIGWIDPDGPEPGEAPRARVDMSQTFEGRWVLDAELCAEDGTIVRSAIDAEVDELFRVGTFSAVDGMSPAERRGYAVVQIFARKGRPGTKHGAPRPSVEVICDERTLQGLPIDDDEDLRTRICELIDGTPLAPASLHRLLCGADVHRLVIAADGEVLDAGKDIRLANRAQRRALRFRHARHCAFPGCEAPTDWTEAHHVTEYDPDPSNDRGRTDMGNLVPLCRYHHHKVHEGGFTLILTPDGQVRVERPPDAAGRRCRITPARPHRRPVETDPLHALARRRIKELISSR